MTIGREAMSTKPDFEPAGETESAEHPLEGSPTDAVEDAQATGEARSSRLTGSFLIRFPDGAETLESLADNGSFPRRGDEVAPGWIADQVEVRDSRTEDLLIDGVPVYLEVSVVARNDYVA
jgi:hypothetical protein